MCIRDSYVAVAIMLHETGCKSNCSSLVRNCNNVGGQKGSPGCNGGAASSSAIGTVSKKLLIINVHSGITKVVYARIRQR